MTYGCTVRIPDPDASFGWDYCDSNDAELTPEYGAGHAICPAHRDDPRLVVRDHRGATILELAHEAPPQ